ncbi:MAG: hypothetical protein Kow00129_04720 [Thermoleophilia bacterium]
MFPLLYWFIDDAAPWMAYLQWSVTVGLMGLTYYQVTRRGLGFMLVFLVMLFIFFVDVLAYLPFLAWLTVRDRRALAGEGS